MPSDLSTLLAELDAKVEGARNLPTHVERIRAYTYLCHDLPDILTTLREGIEQLQRERDEARAERNARARDVMHLEAENERLRALVAQQREALRKAFAVADCTSDVRHVARLDDIHAILGAVLATEGDDHE